MNKTIIVISFIVSVILVDLGISTKAQLDNLRDEIAHLGQSNADRRQKIMNKGILTRRQPVPLSTEYSLVMNQIRLLESYSGTSMNVTLQADRNADDISAHYADTAYLGVHGLKIKIIVNKFSKQTDMGAVLDDIHLLEKNSDFLASELNKINNDLIV